MPEHDELWRADALPLAELQSRFAGSPLMDIGVQRYAGHSALAHHVARAHLLKTVALIEECRLQRALAQAAG